jgi:hypothetical protein
MAPLVNDPIERRLRAGRPDAADVPADAADGPEAAAIRAAARTRPPSALSAGAAPSPRRGRRLVLRTSAVVAVVTALAVVLGWPGSQSGPQEAVARPIALAIHWFDPQPGTILHVRSTHTGDAAGFERTGVAAGGPDETTHQEHWQSVDHPSKARTISELDGRRAEVGSDGIYDPGTDTVYLNVPPSEDKPTKMKDVAPARKRFEAPAEGTDKPGARKSSADKPGADKPAAANETQPATGTDKQAAGKPGGPDESQPAADPTLGKIRSILEHGDARVVRQPGDHGDETYSIDLPREPDPPGGHAVRWTLRIAADGRPLELRIDSGDGTAPLETITWDTYEVVPAGSDLDRLTTVRGAHPDATVVRDADALDAAAGRLFPDKSRVNLAPPPPRAKPKP